MAKKMGVEEISWDNVRKQIYQLKPGFAKIIDEINPKKKPPLFLARYPFGANMVEHGTLMFPSSTGKIVPITDVSISQKVKDHLGYRSIPFCLWLNTSGEVYVELENRRIPLNVFRPGSFCGLWEVLDSPNSAFAKRIWSIAVGSKTIFTLPKISDAININKIEKKYNLHSTLVPKSVFDQIHLFTNVIKNTEKNNEWFSEVLFFSKDWFENKADDKTWLSFNYHLLNEEWQQSVYWRNKVTFDLIGEIFSLAQSHRNLKPSPYLIDTVMYLVAIGMGSSPAFMPIVDDNTYAPIQQLQKFITHDYGLKNYIPTIMCPSYISQKENGLPVYYSMQIPTLLGTAPNLRKPHSVLDDMRMVKRLLESLKVTLEKTSSSTYELIKNVDYDFFHTQADQHSGIKNTLEMPKGDERFLRYPEKERIFCENSSFARGCIRIKKRNDT